MRRRVVRWILLGACGAGLAARALAIASFPPVHPDQFFQYLEPAWWRLTGAGMETWEWRDGVRSWVLPGYFGAWMALFLRLGVRGGASMARLIEAHWGLLSMALVGAGWRGGSAFARRWNRGARAAPLAPTRGEEAPPGWIGGLLGALLCATFPLLVVFSVQTLSEVASMHCLVWAVILLGEAMEESSPDRDGWRKLGAAGALAGFGICLRIQHGPIALVLIAWLLFRRRARALLPLAAGAALPLALFGLVDRVVWGGYFFSFIAYAKFNLMGEGARITQSPPLWYWHLFRQRLPWSWPILVVPALLGIRSTAPLLAAALAVVVPLSTQPFKLERFVILTWPLLVIAAAATIGAWLERWSAFAMSDPRFVSWRHVPAAVAGLALAFVLVDGARHVNGTEFNVPRARLEAQSWVGAQRDVTGLLNDAPMFTGGYVWFGRTLPQLPFSAKLLENPIFSHVLVPRGSDEMHLAERAGFVRAFDEEDFVVLRRADDGASAPTSTRH